MKNIDELARELAKLYDIEVIETPNSHCFVKDNGDIIPFGDPSFWDAFGISFSDRLPYNFEKNIPFIEEVTAFIAKREEEVSFNANKQFSDDVISSENYQYAMAA
jgi:hypothetical protein